MQACTQNENKLTKLTFIQYVSFKPRTNHKREQSFKCKGERNETTLTCKRPNAKAKGEGRTANPLNLHVVGLIAARRRAF